MLCVCSLVWVSIYLCLLLVYVIGMGEVFVLLLFFVYGVVWVVGLEVGVGVGRNGNLKGV